MDNKEIDIQFIEEILKRKRKHEVEDILKGERIEVGVEMLLDSMLRFLAEMPVDKYHDYREFRHSGLRAFLINRFLLVKWMEEANFSCVSEASKVKA